MAKPDRIQLIEEFTIQKGGGQGLREAEEAGLNPKVYRSSLSAGVGRAGRVNLNERIYDVEELISEHERLCREASFNPAHLTHPDSAENFDICAGFVGGETVILEDGSALMRGEFGLLDSYLGKHLEVLYEAGLPIGFSSRAWGRPERHKLDENSPFLSMNPEHEGKTVTLIRDLELEGYDAVRVPSAEVYADAPQNVRESLQAVNEAFSKGRIQEDSQKTGEERVEEADEEGGSAMLLKDITSLEQLQEHAPDLAKLLVAKAVEGLVEAEKLDEANAKIEELTKAVETAELTEAGRDDAVTKLSEQLVEMRAEMKRRDEEAEAKVARAALRAEVSEHLDNELRGVAAQSVIRRHVLEGFDGGRLADLDAVKADVVERLEIVNAHSKRPELSVVINPNRPTEDAESARESANPAPKSAANDALQGMK
ncbi:MAG: hypothetical protein GY871_04425 [Actinomycetales bacterium]|nr:hypothetical protein [Actinomycetales bacterium]